MNETSAASVLYFIFMLSFLLTLQSFKPIVRISMKSPASFDIFWFIHIDVSPGFGGRVGLFICFVLLCSCFFKWNPIFTEVLVVGVYFRGHLLGISTRASNSVVGGL